MRYLIKTPKPFRRRAFNFAVMTLLDSFVTIFSLGHYKSYFRVQWLQNHTKGDSK